MIDPNSLADWNLNDEDREAIQWSLDAIEKLKAERDELRKEFGEERHANWKKTEAIRALVKQLAEVVAR